MVETLETNQKIWRVEEEMLFKIFPEEDYIFGKMYEV
jgi:hypothetical protein